MRFIQESYTFSCRSFPEFLGAPAFDELLAKFDQGRTSLKVFGSSRLNFG